MATQQDFVRITHLARTANNAWMFRIDLDNIHAEFVEQFMHELARSGIFCGGWFVGTWWFDDEAMILLSHLFSNWDEMRATALAVEGVVTARPALLPE